MPQPKVMGVLNVTPDSFSDGGTYLASSEALARALALVSQGADILDIGGESTRPGASPVPLDTELRRVIPLISAIRVRSGIPISIDTMKPEVAKAAILAGAGLWNDVTALQAPGAPDMAAALGCEVILMHMQGEPGTMQQAPAYDDVVGEVLGFLADRARVALEAGVKRERIWLDPGIGFGKTLAHNLALLAQLDRLVALGFPVLLGASRKRFIAELDPAGDTPEDRLGGSLAAVLAGADAGVAGVRVHDVAETVQALKVWQAIKTGR